MTFDSLLNKQMSLQGTQNAGFSYWNSPGETPHPIGSCCCHGTKDALTSKNNPLTVSEGQDDISIPPGQDLEKDGNGKEAKCTEDSNHEEFYFYYWVALDQARGNLSSDPAFVPPSPGYFGQATHVSRVLFPPPEMGGLGQIFPTDSSQICHSTITGFKESLVTKH